MSGGSTQSSRPTVRQRLRYAFDNTMSRGTPALVGWLAIATIILIFIFTVIVLVGQLAPAEGGRPGLIGQFFKNILHAIDPGTIANDSGDWPFLVAMLGLTLGGLLIFSALIGVVATGVDRKLEDLRKGRSRVIETGHTLILGWSDTVFTILSELAIANENEKDPCVVILADHDKVEMEDAIRAKVRHTNGTRIVCRSGSPIDLHDLDLVNPKDARSILVLAPEADEPGVKAKDPDAQVIKVVLALTKGEGHADRAYHIVAEVHDPENLAIAKLVGGEEAVLIDKRQTVSRLLVQAARQSGVSVVYTELLDFGGDEIYFRNDPGLSGKTFGDALSAYENCSVIGVRSHRGVEINPPMDTKIGPKDEVIAIAEDDGQLAAAVPAAAAADEAAIVSSRTPPTDAQQTLILGWNGRGPSVINELDDYVKPGSTVTVVADRADPQEGIQAHPGELRNLDVRVQKGDTTDRRTLDALGIGDFDHVIVLCYSDELEAQQADARTLMTLLNLRDIADKADLDLTIVSEMLDDRNRQLAEATRVDDVIVSNRVISLMLAQIAENRHLKEVFAELFAAEGSEIYLRPASNYVAAGGQTNFATVVEAAGRLNEVAIGFRLKAASRDSARHYGVVVNPPKSHQFSPAAEDWVIVLAED